MNQSTTTSDREQDGPAYGWRRWLFASMLGDILSVGIALGGTTYLGENVIRSAPGLDIAAFYGIFLAALLCTSVGGALGGVLHWLLVGRRLGQAWWWTTKWTLSFLGSMLVLYFVLAEIDDVVRALAAWVGVYPLLALMGTVLGIVIAWAVGDTRPAA